MAIRSAIGTYTTRNGDQDPHSLPIQTSNFAELLVKRTDVSTKLDSHVFNTKFDQKELVKVK